jgi:hypothetical protein
MRSKNGRIRAKNTDRQLTLGECIALARYAQAMTDEDPAVVRLGDVLDLIDRLEVCTTCGWSAQLHSAVAGGEAPIGLCTGYTREGVHNAD